MTSIEHEKRNREDKAKRRTRIPQIPNKMPSGRSGNQHWKNPERGDTSRPVRGEASRLRTKSRYGGRVLARVLLGQRGSISSVRKLALRNLGHTGKSLLCPRCRDRRLFTFQGLESHLKHVHKLKGRVALAQAIKSSRIRISKSALQARYLRRDPGRS